MNVDQQLHRAAHRVRELEVDVPEFAPPRAAWRRMGPSIVAGLLLVGGTATVMTHHPSPTGSDPGAAAVTTVGSPAPLAGTAPIAEETPAPAGGDADAAGAAGAHGGSDGETGPLDAEPFGAVGPDTARAGDEPFVSGEATPTVEEELILIRSIFRPTSVEPDPGTTGEQRTARPAGVS